LHLAYRVFNEKYQLPSYLPVAQIVHLTGGLGMASFMRLVFPEAGVPSSYIGEIDGTFSCG